MKVVYVIPIHFDESSVVAGAALNIALNFLLIPRLGFVGVALATLATYLLILIGIGCAAYIVLYRRPIEHSVEQSALSILK